MLHRNVIFYLEDIFYLQKLKNKIVKKKKKKSQIKRFFLKCCNACAVL